jgi:hypothetical protein
MSPRRPSTLSPRLVRTSLGEAATLIQAGTLLASELIAWMEKRHPELVVAPLPDLTQTTVARAKALERAGRRCLSTDGSFHRCVHEIGHKGIHQWEP